MIDIYTIYFILLLLSGLISLILSIFIWEKFWHDIKLNVGKTLSILMVFVSIWAFGSAFALFSNNISITYFFEQFKYIGIIFVPPTWLIFSIQWISKSNWIVKKWILLIYFIPIILLFLIFTDNFHHLIWTNIEYIPIGQYMHTQVVHGIGWWLIFSFSYILLFFGTFNLIRKLFAYKNIYRKQVTVLLIGCLAPWIANAIYSLNLNPLTSLDFTPTAFFITGLTLTWGFFQFGLIDIRPIAKNVVFENMDDPVIILDSQNRVVDITPLSQRILNKNISELIGKKVEEAFIDQKDFIEKLENEKEFQVEVCFNRKDKNFCFDMKKTNLYDSKNNYNGKIIVLRDITERKKFEESLQQSEAAYRAIFENTGTATIIVEDNTIISLANKCFQELSGYSKEEIEGVKSWTEFVAEKDLKNMMDFHKNRRDNNNKYIPKNYEFQFIDKKGNLKELCLTIDIIPGTKKSVASLLDITKRKMVLNELKDAHELLYTVNKDLERKVKSRTVKIEKLIEQKDDFINQLGHDLKTPLTPIMALMPIFKNKIENPQDKEMVEILMRNIYYMRDLVSKTIDLAKLNSDKIKFRFENTNLLTEIENSIHNNNFLIEKNNIEIENNIEKNIVVVADKLRLNELLSNLITNSIKYTPITGGKIIIDAIEENEFMKISIKDTGIGMTQNQINHIFDEFYKADDSRHDLDSSGLGLTICQRIVKKHGGKIWANSQGKDKGSTFYFTLKNAV